MYSCYNSYLCIKGVMKAFVARGVTLGLETSVESHNTLGSQTLIMPVQNFMSGRSFEFYNSNLGRFNFQITTQKSGRWNKPVTVITVVTA
jgi:translation elongation factor EF-Tu-like GTPase